MNISIIVGGRFHAFNLAEELDSKGHLQQLITSYPKFYIKNNFNIDIKKVQTIILKEIFSRIPFIQKPLENYISNYFEKAASDKINLNKIDILIGWAGFSLQSFEMAKKYNCLKILERGSTHIEFQRDILLEEYNMLRIKPKLPSQELISKEIKEYQLADYIIVPSEFAKKTFIERGIDKKKVIKIPYGVNINHFNDERSKRNSDELFRIVYVGNCSVRKGIIYLLKAFSELNLNNSELLIVGNIEKELLPLISKYLNNKKVKYLKSQKQINLKNYYNISNVFITCSIEEGLSMVQLQAMACGLPVICTRNSGGEEIIKHNYEGFILPIRDITELKNKITYLYENAKICEQMGNNAKEKSKSHFTWSDYGLKVISTYQNILKTKLNDIQ